MSKEVHIDQFIQEKLELLNFPYDESFWKDAEKLIIEAEREKRKRFLWWIFLITLLVASFVIYSVLSSPNKSNFTHSNSSTINSNTSDFISIKNSNNPIANSSVSNEITQKIIDTNSNEHWRIKSIVRKNSNRKNIRNKKSNSYITRISDGSLVVMLDPFAKEVQQKVDDSIELLKNMAMLNPHLLDIPNEFNLWLTEEENQKKYNKRSSFLGFSGGTTFNNSFGMAYFASVHTQKLISKKWSARMAAQLVSSKFPFLSYKYSTIDYSFGELAKNTEIKSDVVYSVQIPISFHYRFYKFHSGFLGLGYSRYIAQKNSITTESNGTKKVSYEKGYSKDLRENNFFVTVGYESLVFKKYQIGVSAQLPLLNPVVNLQKESAGSSNNYLELKVYVLYNILKLR